MDIDIAYFLLALRIFARAAILSMLWRHVGCPHVRNSLVAADGDLKHGDEQKLEGLIQVIGNFWIFLNEWAGLLDAVVRRKKSSTVLKY